MNLATFDPAGQSRATIIAAQKALRKVKCYNGDLDADWGDWCRAGQYLFNRMTASGGRIAKFVNRSPVLINPDGSWELVGPGNVDGDGSGGNAEHDPDFQPDTTYHLNGKPLNARTTAFMVATRDEMDEVPGRNLGAKSRLTNIETGASVDTVVGDEGGPEDDGEMSIYAAGAVGVDANPVTGGESRPIIHYQVWPGVEAVIVIEGETVTCPLQAL